MNYKKVIEDFNSGVLDSDRVQLIMDNDGGHWLATNEDGEFNDIRSEELENTYGSPDGYRDIVDVLKAAGINAEWC